MTGRVEEPRSPRVIHPLESPDRGSTVKIIEGIQPPQGEGAPIIPDKGSAIKITKTTPSQPKNTLLEIPERYWHIFGPME